MENLLTIGRIKTVGNKKGAKKKFERKRTFSIINQEQYWQMKIEPKWVSRDLSTALQFSKIIKYKIITWGDRQKRKLW